MHGVNARLYLVIYNTYDIIHYTYWNMHLFQAFSEYHFAPVSWQYQNNSTNWSLQLDTITKDIFYICAFLGCETMQLHKHYQCFVTQVAKILASITTEISSLNKITYFHLWLYLPNITHTSNEVILLKFLSMVTPCNTLK